VRADRVSINAPAWEEQDSLRERISGSFVTDMSIFSKGIGKFSVYSDMKQNPIQ